MSKDNQSNPFFALVSPSNEDIPKSSYSEKSDKESFNTENINSSVESNIEVSTIQKILLTTTAVSEASNCCIVLKDFDEVSLDSIGILLFERILFLDSFEGDLKSIINFPEANSVATTKTDPFIYLYECHERCDIYRNKENLSIVDNIHESIFVTYKTLLLQPDILTSDRHIKDLRKFLLMQICYNVPFVMFLNKVLMLLDMENSECPDIFKQVLQDASMDLNKCTILNIDKPMVAVFQFYASSKYLAKLLVLIPIGPITQGVIFQRTPMGSLLSISCIPRSPQEPYEVSSQLSTVETVNLSQRIIANLDWLRSEIHNLFLTLLKSNTALKDGLLKWIESCIVHNIEMSTEWNLRQSELLPFQSFVSVGFMTNLCAVMLLLSQPFVNDCSSNCKVLKVDPTYCSSDAHKKEGINGYYGAGLYKITPLVPRPEDEIIENLPKEYSFVTSCFFLTHRVLDMCITIVQYDLKNTSQQNSRLQQRLTTATNPEMRNRLKDLIAKAMSKHMTLVLAFFDDQFAAPLVNFCASTCLWLSQISLFPNEDRQSLKSKSITSSILEETENLNNILLHNIPEFVVENVVSAINLYNRLQKNILANCSQEKVYQFFTFIACFMGSPNRIHNPHNRAKIAETLNSVMSVSEESNLLSIGHGNTLVDHHLSPSLTSALMHVFVSIEMTGSTVAFEEKFNYRLPMYDVIKKMWSVPKLRREFVKLAKYALHHMESAQPPLFLRFVNLLINDAIFLLDEGLSYMTQLKQQIAERDNGEWHTLNEEQLTTRRDNLEQMTLLAGFHNTLATKTIETIIKLTSEVPLLFAHSTLVDRVAAMLNHFLQQLVGPKRKEYKVRDMEKYKFRPADIVANICTIYHNLHDQESFAVAVINDGRSYSPMLFSNAIMILERTGNFTLSTDIRKVEEVVQETVKKHKLDDDIAASAPDEFLDPIMIQVMNDPVLLPSSNVIVDRATIARHLLSDQSDPFNRQPLTMEEVLPCPELKEKISKWRQNTSADNVQ